MCSEPAMRAPAKGLAVGVFFPQCHQTGHFGFGNGDFLASPFGQGHIGDFIIGKFIVRRDWQRQMRMQD